MDENIKWRPIETAPKDGDLVIVCYEWADTAFAHVAWYRDGDKFEEIGYPGHAKHVDGWWSYIRNSVSQEKLDGPRTPTHWIPFPD